ncbi:MAG: GerMN domain-containing protein [Fimbriimonadaceae bacterium]|nr:GerMN domain-containing protein [Fimbriimonadaceae bacterium]
MTKKRKNHKPTNGLWAVLLAGALVAGSVAAWVQMTDNKSIPISERRSPTERPGKPAKVHVPQSEGETVAVLKPRYDGDAIKYDRTEAQVPKGIDKMVFAVNEFLRESDIAPKDARATKAVLTERGELRLQFNNAFDRTYGSEEERALVDGILHSLGQFKEIVNVQFCIGDQPMETLGHIDLSTPQAVLRDGS